MSMILSLTSVSDENIIKIHENPLLLWKIIAPDEPDIFERNIQNRIKNLSFLWKFLGKKSKLEQLLKMDLDIDKNRGEGSTTDLDKAWHAIHFILTDNLRRKKFPQSFLLNGGSAVVDSGLDLVRTFSGAKVQEISDFLNSIDSVAFIKRFNPAALTNEKIYPEEVWGRPDEQIESRDYVLEYFDGLKNFVDQAKAQKLGLVLWFN